GQLIARSERDDSERHRTASQTRDDLSDGPVAAGRNDAAISQLHRLLRQALGIARGRRLRQIERGPTYGECAADLATHSRGLLLTGGGIKNDQQPVGVGVGWKANHRTRPAEPDRAAISRSRATRSSVGGCVRKRFDIPPPPASGLMIAR